LFRTVSFCMAFPAITLRRAALVYASAWLVLESMIFCNSAKIGNSMGHRMPVAVLVLAELELTVVVTVVAVHSLFSLALLGICAASSGGSRLEVRTKFAT
jgi:hypothetical protein